MRSPERQAAKPDKAEQLALVEAFDNFAPFRNGIRRLAAMTDEWAGIPMPLDGEQLVIEPSYPKAAELMQIGAKTAEPSKYDGAKIINSWWSSQRQADVVVFEHDGKRDWGLDYSVHHVAMDLQTMGCSYAWGIEQEANAVHLLASLLRHHQFKSYMLTGMFLEKSARSAVTYIFRRLRPTVALRPHPRRENMRILCCLCLHPIGYYMDTWAGAMCPTDDVIAHLMMMRGDEHMFWRRSNQIAPYRKQAGL